MKNKCHTRFALHLVLGPPASGKTTYAKRLAERLAAALVDIDIATEPIVRAALGGLGWDADDRDSPDFKRLFREPIYDALFAIANANLPHTHVVLTGPFTKELRNPRWLDDIARERLDVAAPIHAHYLHCAPATLHQRMKRRGNPRDAAKLADWEAYLKYYGELAPPAFPHTLVENG